LIKQSPVLRQRSLLQFSSLQHFLQRLERRPMMFGATQLYK